MEIKKYPNALLENYSKILIQLGLVLALFIVYEFIKMKSYPSEIKSLTGAFTSTENIEETVEVKIPAGVEDGMQLRVSGKGNEALSDGLPGDLLVLINELPDENLKREGNNLHYDLYISISEAVLGISKEINTVSDKVRIKLDAGIQSGKILRLRGKGLKSINGYGNGDLLVHVNVWTPKTLNKEQREFFQQMKNNEHFTPNPDKNDKSFFEKVKHMFS